jgi:hypothetical protein
MLQGMKEPTNKSRPRATRTTPKPRNDDAISRITIAGQEEWLASEEGQRFLAMSETERDAYRSELLKAPALEPFWRFVAEWVQKIRTGEDQEREASAWLKTACCRESFVEVEDRPKDPLENRALFAELWSRPDHLLFRCAKCREVADLKVAADVYLAANRD